MLFTCDGSAVSCFTKLVEAMKVMMKTVPIPLCQHSIGARNGVKIAWKSTICIAQDGIEHVTSRFAEIIARKIPTKALAYQFILEELDGASRGNTASQRFAERSGIAADAYRNALSNSNPDVDSPDGPQQLLLGLSMDLSRNTDLMAEFRCEVDDKIMKKFRLGRYAGEPEESPDAASNDLADMLAAFTPGNDDDFKRGAARFL